MADFQIKDTECLKKGLMIPDSPLQELNLREHCVLLFQYFLFSFFILDKIWLWSYRLLLLWKNDYSLIFLFSPQLFQKFKMFLPVGFLIATAAFTVHIKNHSSICITKRTILIYLHGLSILSVYLSYCVVRKALLIILLVKNDW